MNNTKEKKLNKKIIILSIVVVALIVITSVTYFVFLQDDTSKFYGSWQSESVISNFGESDDTDQIWTFYENKSLKINNKNNITWSTWEINENKLSLIAPPDISIPFTSIDVGYEFSNNDNNLKINMNVMGITVGMMFVRI